MDQTTLNQLHKHIVSGEVNKDQAMSDGSVSERLIQLAIIADSYGLYFPA